MGMTTIQKLDESKPEEIRQVCARLLQETRENAVEMGMGAIMSLDYSKLDEETIVASEDAFLYMVTGERRSSVTGELRS
jgi:hypothetical protein